MPNVTSFRLIGIGLAALLTMAAALSTTATFQADTPGSNLEPVNGAEFLIDLVQGQETMLWSSLTGQVTAFEIAGWPSTDGEHELGGALMIERPEDGLAGVIDTGEKPMSAVFEVVG